MERSTGNTHARRPELDSLSGFYTFYQTQHRSRMNRRLHFVGTTGLLCALGIAIVNGDWRWLLAVPLSGYGFAWAGHFFFEKNKPATFSYPLYSFVCDFLMYRDMVLRRISF